jgi:hypothetical protein
MAKYIARLLVLITTLALLMPLSPLETRGAVLASSGQVPPAGSEQAPAETWVVNNTYDESGTCLPQFCSLRQAIAAANNRVPDTIIFDIPTNDPGYSPRTGQWTIHLGSPLPVLSGSDSLTIDATSLGEPGNCQSYVVIDAASIPYGLEVTGANKTLSGLVLRNAQSYGLYIHNSGAQNNQLTCSYVVSNTVDGVRIGDGANGNSIGSANASLPNVIAMNGDDGIEITGSAHDNTITNNRIGTNEAGTSARANGGYGVRISGDATANTIGLAGSGGGNLISGNGLGGILISGSGARDNVVQYDTIGTNGSGTAALGSQQDGVVITSAPNNTIGPGNLISGHARDDANVPLNETPANHARIRLREALRKILEEPAVRSALAGS